MTQINQIYRCNICGNMVEMVHSGAGQLVCCGQPMELLEGKTKDEGLEKHSPVLERAGNVLKIKIGSIAHPMENSHFIEWIEVISGNKTFKKFLQPKDSPEAQFENIGQKVFVRSYCNIHGLWKK